MVNTIEKEITVKELKELYQSGEYKIEIDSPDGYQEIVDWFDKGVLNMVSIETEGFKSDCAVNHLIQKEDESWVPAEHLQVGDKVITAVGIQTIKSVKLIEPMECFDFTVDHDNHRYYGDGICSHNSGKSYVVSGNVARNAQEQGIHVLMIDSERALDEDWLQSLGVDTSPEMLTKVNMSQINDVAKFINDFVEYYKTENANVDVDEQPPIMIIVDSLGMLNTPQSVAQFEKGDMKGDMGHKPKQLKALVTNVVNMIGGLNIGLVCTNHTYESQDMFNPDPKVSGGSGFIFAASIVLVTQKSKLKLDETGEKTTTVNGIRMNAMTQKTRFTKPFEKVTVNIPYKGGMDPYSGLFDMFLDQLGILTKSGISYIYKNVDTGEELKLRKKQWLVNEDGCLDLVMAQFYRNPLIPDYLKGKHEVQDEDYTPETIEDVTEDTNGED